MVKVLRLENTRWGVSTSKAEDVDKILEFDPANGVLSVHTLSTPKPIGFQSADQDLLTFLHETIGENLGSLDIKMIHNHPVLEAYSAPFKLYLDITSVCSLPCSFCLQSDRKSETTLPLTVIQKIAQELAQLGIMYVKIGGGDPLLHPNFPEVLSTLRSAGCFLSLSTNSVSITPQIVELLARHSVRVSVSIEGMRSVNDSQRGAGHFDKALKALEMLQAAGINTLLRTTLLSQNLSEVPQLVELAKNLRTKIKFAYCRPAGRAVSNQTIIGKAERAAYLRTIDYLNSPDVIPHILLDEGMMISQPTETVPKLFRGRMCGAANRSMHIDPAGKVSPCIFMGPTFTYGMVYYDGTIADFWRGLIGNKFQVMRDIRQPQECDGCERICKNECIANRFYFWGKYDRQDPNCLYFAPEEA